MVAPIRRTSYRILHHAHCRSARESGKERVRARRAEMLARDLREHGAKVRRQCQVASFVQLLWCEARPFSVHLVSLHVTADHEESTRVAMVRAAISILLRHAPELRHRHDDDVVHSIAKIRHERSDRLREIGETVGELAGRSALIHVRVPSADIRERDLQAEVRLHELRDLPETLPEG
jgi:hypothetical protein